MIENSPDEVNVSHPLTKRTVHLYTGKKLKIQPSFYLVLTWKFAGFHGKSQFGKNAIYPVS